MRRSQKRQEILTFLTNNSKAYTAQHIHENLKDMDLATVYRNLKKLVETGAVRELRVQKGESMYEINKDGHDHAICESCGKIQHIKVDKKKLAEVLNIPNFEVDDIEVNIKGHCK